MITEAYLEVLFESDQTDKEWKKLYRDLMMKHHPDRHKGDKSMEEISKKLSGAWKDISKGTDYEKKAKAYAFFTQLGKKNKFKIPKVPFDLKATIRKLAKKKISKKRMATGLSVAGAVGYGINKWKEKRKVSKMSPRELQLYNKRKEWKNKRK